MPASKAEDPATTMAVVEKVAVLATRRLKQGQIAARLGLSQSTVSRRLADAYTYRMIEAGHPVWCGTQARLEEIDRLLQPAEELEKRLRALSRAADRLLEVRIFEDASVPGRSPETDFGARAARFLIESRIPRTGRVGVAWGGMLLNVARAVEQAVPSPLRGYEELNFLPICGDPPEVDENPRRSAANIAAQLEEAITGSTDFKHSFSSVAACIPAGFEGERADTIRDFFRTIPGYRLIFGSGKSKQRGVIQDLDGVLTSLGTNERNVRWLEAAAHAAGCSSEDLARATPGNIGGLFLAGQDATAEQRALVDRVNDRWTGIRLADLKSCARSAAREEGRLGVVMIAGRGGAQRDIAIECVRQGLANRLFLSPRTAQAIMQTLSPEQAAEATPAD